MTDPINRADKMALDFGVITAQAIASAATTAAEHDGRADHATFWKEVSNALAG